MALMLFDSFIALIFFIDPLKLAKNEADKVEEGIVKEKQKAADSEAAQARK